MLCLPRHVSAFLRHHCGFTAVYLKPNGYATLHYNYVSHYFFTHYSQHTDQRLMFVELILTAVDTDTYFYYSRDYHIAEQMPEACPKK